MKIKIYISTNYIVEQRSDKCRKHENVKKRAIKNNKKTIKKKLFKNYLKLLHELSHIVHQDLVSVR